MASTCTTGVLHITCQQPQLHEAPVGGYIKVAPSLRRLSQPLTLHDGLDSPQYAGAGEGQCSQLRLPCRRRALMPLFVGACVASAAFPVWFLINADVGHMPLSVSFAAGFLGGMLASPPGPNAR